MSCEVIFKGNIQIDNAIRVVILAQVEWYSSLLWSCLSIVRNRGVECHDDGGHHQPQEKNKHFAMRESSIEVLARLYIICNTMKRGCCGWNMACLLHNVSGVLLSPLREWVYYDRPSDTRKNSRVHSTFGAALLYLNSSLLRDSISSQMDIVKHLFIATNAKSLRNGRCWILSTNDRVYASPMWFT